MDQVKKVVLITGGSSGIGYESSIMFAKNGYKVYTAARRLEKMESLKEYGITPIYLDVTDDEVCKSCVDEIINKEGKIDILINNAGYGSLGPIEMVDLEEAKKQLDVNVYGIVRITKLVVPYMRKQKSGRIINISSAAGRVTTYLGGWYHVSKYAVEALSDSLRMELKDFGIDVVIIEPGAIESARGDIAADHLEEARKKFSIWSAM